MPDEPFLHRTVPGPLKCLAQSCSRVQWLCDELGIPYHVEKAGFRGASVYFKILPQHTTSQQQASVLAPIIESGAVLMYITSAYGNGRLSIPPTDTRFPQYLRWVWACEAGAMVLVDRYQELRDAAPSAQRELKLAQLRGTAFDLFAHADLAMRGQEYIMGGEFTLADIMLCYALATVFGCGLVRRNDVPYLAAYLDRLRARPACKVGAA